MSGEMRTLQFSVSTSDPEHWTPLQRKAAADCEDPDCTSPHDHVMHHLDAYMRRYGEEFVETYPQMFRTPLM